MNNEQINLLMEELESNLNEINSTNKNIRKKKKQLEEEENEKIKQISEKMNNILSNNYQTITDSVNNFNGESESEVDKMFRKNMIINERLIVADMFFKLYPQLEKDRKNIIDKILCTTKQKIELYVLEKIIINGVTFYKDTQGYIIDTNINVVGICVNDINIDRYIVFKNIDKTEICDKGFEIIKELDKHFNLHATKIK